MSNYVQKQRCILRIKSKCCSSIVGKCFMTALVSPREGTAPLPHIENRTIGVSLNTNGPDRPVKYHEHTVVVYKGCCIYEKPRRFDESESESSEDECENCFGHVERRHKHRAPGHAHDTTVAMATTTTTTTAELQNETEPNVEVTLQPSEEPPAPPTPPAS
ncbi:Protein phosphatase 1 regulatory subunit 11 [Papilio machaon]|uniref:Protein phosphatase 1 regulatory subunit 11 n=1 Tax=Papilio machaon TaxID=76193 RepID=A0A194R6H7_PAPMA|nr:Protein phosphatase 1 regulatory subunit 11 [Papilio machaon]